MKIGELSWCFFIVPNFDFDGQDREEIFAWCQDLLAVMRDTLPFSQGHIYTFHEWLMVWSSACSVTATYGFEPR